MSRKRGAEWQRMKIQILEAYEEGYTIKDITRRFNIGTATLYSVLRSACVKRTRSFGKKVSATEDEVSDLYLSGVPTKEIAERFNIGIMTVYLMLREAGVVLPSPQERLKKYKALKQDQIDKIVSLYRSREMNVSQLAREFNVSTTSIYKELKLAGFTFQNLTGSKAQCIKHEFSNGRVCIFRSTWELLFAKDLDRRELDWAYESHTFKLSDDSMYTPDFWVPVWSVFIEIKGFMTDESRVKINMFRAEYPHLRLLVLNKQSLELYGLKIAI